MRSLKASYVLALAAAVAGSDLITNLPGYPGGKTPFDMYRCVARR